MEILSCINIDTHYLSVLVINRSYISFANSTLSFANLVLIQMNFFIVICIYLFFRRDIEMIVTWQFISCNVNLPTLWLTNSIRWV